MGIIEGGGSAYLGFSVDLQPAVSSKFPWEGRDFVPGETSAFFVSIVDKLIKPTKLLLPSQYGIAHLEEGVFTERKGEPKKLGQCSNF